MEVQWKQKKRKKQQLCERSFGAGGFISLSKVKRQASISSFFQIKKEVSS